MEEQKFIAKKRVGIYMPTDTDRKLKKIIKDKNKLKELSEGDPKLEEAIKNYQNKKNKISQNQLSLIIIESCINRISI